MKAVRLILFVSFIALLFDTSQATDYNFKNFTTRNGLPHNYINDIYKDSAGFVWIATRNGVCRYDGYNFRVISSIDEDKVKIPSFSQRVFESADGIIWVFGPKRFSYFYDGKDFHGYSNDFRYGYPDNNGNIWFVTDSSLIMVNKKELKFSTGSKSEKSHRLQLICKERHDKIWAFRDFSLKDLIQSSNGFYSVFKFKARYYINHVYIDSKSNVWISTSNHGLINFNQDGKNFEHYTYSSEPGKGLTSNHVYSVSEIDGKMYIGTMNGINILDKKNRQFTYIKREPYKKSTLSDDKVTCFLQDPEGVLFLGTRFGLDIAHESKFHHFYKMEGQNSLTNNNVHGFVEDGKDVVWIISSGGLDRFDIKTRHFENHPVNTTDNKELMASPISIIEDEKGNLWIGTWQGGLYYYYKKSNSYKRFLSNGKRENSISNNSIMSLFRDTNNDIWIGTWGGGLNYYDKKQRRFLLFEHDRENPNSISNNEVSSFAEDKYGRIWVGTSNGLNLLADKNNKIFKRFFHDPENENTLSNNYINSLLISDNNLWIGTEAGLDKFNLNTFTVRRYDTRAGLPSNQIRAVLQDDKGDLWVSTNKGIAKIEFKKESDSVKQVVVFTMADGLQEEEFLNRSALRTSGGEFFFGGTNGFNMFKPSEIVPDTVAPRCVLTKLFIDDKVVNEGDTLFGDVILKKPIYSTDNISFSYKQKSFSIEFSGLHFFEPDDVIYQYKLEGFDKNWKTADARHRIATYTNINQGDYVFLLKAANRYKHWSNPVKIKIEVIPPFWKTVWFNILLVIFVLLLIYFFVELRIKIIKKQKRNLEKIIQVRIAEVARQKEEIKQQALQIEEMNKLLKKHNLELKGNIENLSKARVMQKLLDFKEFKKVFPDKEACENYLIELKWGKGFKCTRCGSKDYSLEDNNSRRCRKCNYKESITSGTIFHHLRFPLDKALYILIVTSTGRKINVSELSRTLNLRLKTVWNFHNKVKEELSFLESPIKSDKGWTSLIITPKKPRVKPNY